VNNNIIIQSLEKEYTEKFSKSLGLYLASKDYFVNSVSQPGRHNEPFPVYIKSAKGSSVNTVDGESMLDFWQGHFCNVLGHNPDLIQKAIQKSLKTNLSLQLGFPTALEGTLANQLLDITGFDKCIFTTSGASATMSGILLSLAYTGKTKILKIKGGWHGAQPWSMKGVRYPISIDNEIYEGAGAEIFFEKDILTVGFNDEEGLKSVFKNHGNQIGVFIMEPVLGNSGMTIAKKSFMKLSRSLTKEYGAVLFLDEIVTGFRTKLGGSYEHYGIKPDIVAFGKAISGGMPFACLCGEERILKLSSIKQIPRVWADSGTFTSHPMTLQAVVEMIKHYRKNPSIFNRIVKKADKLRSGTKF
jgi:glutamate-1-semialdehyde 2,1-aminomutase